MSNRTHAPSESDIFLHRPTRVADAAHSQLEDQIAQLDALVDAALNQPTPTAPPLPMKPDATTIWGVPFSQLTMAETLHHIDRLIEHGEPGYFITANLNYNMLTDQRGDLQEVNRNASFIVCDGMPMVWYSRLTQDRLPERIAGSELIYAMNRWAAVKGHRVFFLGGAPGVAQQAADCLTQRYPGLQVAGVESPPYRELTSDEEAALIQRVRAARPDILYVALGQPKGELWIANHCRALGIPVCAQVGASFDFVAGGVTRAPQWMQKWSLEWLYRLAQEPRRLVGRYWRNGLFLLKAVARDVIRAGAK